MFKAIIFAVVLYSTVLIFDIQAENIVTSQQIATAKKALMTAIERENECTVADECALMPVGARACGGPSDYVAYSLISSNYDEIDSLATLTSSLEEKYNTQNGIMSICAILSEPSVLCNESRKCTTGPANDFSGPVRI